MFGRRHSSPISKGLAGTHAARYINGGSDDSQAGGEAADAGAELPEKQAPFRQSPKEAPEFAAPRTREAVAPHIVKIRDQILPQLIERIDVEAAADLNREELRNEFAPLVAEVLTELRLTLSRPEQEALEQIVIDEVIGYGPIEMLLADPEVTDIMVNGPNQIYIEKRGKLELTDVIFRNEDHVRAIANRICNRVGRRVDQSQPLADARLEDGSRVNVILPPLSLRGTAISIRKFSKKPIDLDQMIRQENLSANMAKFLKMAGHCRLNIVVSGGTGSGKTTMLNAISKMIDDGERVVTIEDAAELQLMQPHVIPLETRPKNLEGEGEISIRDLMINALRMRPDRIILGEVRGPECIDMLQAMNTGHEGSMCTLHANSPREALTRMENMAMMSGLKYPMRAIRQQIADAIDAIVQVSRMRDGGRRVVQITEVVGTEGDVITTQDLFEYQYERDSEDGKMIGTFEATGMVPHAAEKFRQFGFDKAAREIF